MRTRLKPSVLFIAVLILFTSCQNDNQDQDHPHDSLFFIDYRNLEEGADGMAVIELDPESTDFESISSKLELGVGVLPHHIYFDNDAKKLYTTVLGGSYLYQIKTGEDHNGFPILISAKAINAGGNTVGEDIFFTSDGRYFVTFMGGSGGSKDGSIGVFNAKDNQLIKTIKAPIETNADKFIMYPDGISVNEKKRSNDGNLYNSSRPNYRNGQHLYIIGHKHIRVKENLSSCRLSN